MKINNSLVNKKKKLVKIFIKNFKLRKNSKKYEDMFLGDGEWDSINHVKLITDLEKVFKLKIDNRNFNKFISFKKCLSNLKN
tara:strand:+ start:77 stop:322 length:246 start_codon:yes stop_codon:yes gene_type:complete